MKKIKLALTISFGIFINQSLLFAAPVSISVIAPTTNGWQNIFKLSDFVKFHPKDFERSAGKRMNFLGKIVFKMTQHKMKHYLEKHRDVTVEQYIKIEKTEKRKFGSLWFIIGLLGPVIGVLTGSIAGFIVFLIAPIAVVYLAKRTKSEKASVWFGWVLALLILLAIGFALNPFWGF